MNNLPAKVKPHLNPSHILIRYYRKMADLTLMEVERMTGLKKETISSWERGISHPRPTNLAKIAVAYNTPIEDFFNMELDEIKQIATSVVKEYLEDPETPLQRKAYIAVKILSITAPIIDIKVQDEGVSENPLHKIIEGKA